MTSENQTLPMNPTTGKPYAGGNIMILSMMTCHPSQQFAGFNQWLRAGRVVKKGEKGTQILAAGSRETTDPQTNEVKKTSFCKTLTVFALEQTEVLVQNVNHSNLETAA